MKNLKFQITFICTLVCCSLAQNLALAKHIAIIPKTQQAIVDVIMSSNNPLYLNIAQTDFPKDPFAPTWSINTLERVYGFNPIPESLTADQKRKIIGTEASVWTEFISSAEHLEFMLLPRLPAFSESAWSGEEKKDFDDFILRLNNWHYLNWKFSGTRFHPKHFERSIY